jgi:hypothetical protein
MRQAKEDNIILGNFEECKKHIIEKMNDTSARNKVLGICEWLYSVKPSNSKYGHFLCYSTKKGGIRFFLNEPFGGDHFLCLIYSPSPSTGSCWATFYYKDAKTRTDIPPYAENDGEQKNVTR